MPAGTQVRSLMVHFPYHIRMGYISFHAFRQGTALPRPYTRFRQTAWRDASTYSGLIPAVRITLPHLSVSSAMNLPNSAGVIGSGVPPKSARRALSVGSVSTALIALLSLSMTSAGVFLGAPTPYHPLAS